MKKIPKHLLYTLMLLVFLALVVYVATLVLVLAVILAPLWLPLALALWLSHRLFDIDGTYDHDDYVEGVCLVDKVDQAKCEHDYSEAEYEKEIEMKKGLVHIVRYSSCMKCGHRVFFPALLPDEEE